MSDNVLEIVEAVAVGVWLLFPLVLVVFCDPLAPERRSRRRRVNH